MDHKGLGTHPGSAERGEVLQHFCLCCIFPTILQSNQQLGAADWKITRKACLYGYFVFSNPPKLYSHFWRYFGCFSAGPINRTNLTFGYLSKTIWITALLSAHPFLNAGLWLVPATLLFASAVLNNMKNWEHLTSGEQLWSRILLAVLPNATPHQLSLSGPSRKQNFQVEVWI